jgi:hypothetical protein
VSQTQPPRDVVLPWLRSGSDLITLWDAFVFGDVQFPDPITGAGANVFRAGGVRTPQRLYMFDIAREQRQHSAMLTTLKQRHVYSCGQSKPSGPAEGDYLTGFSGL